MLGRVFTEGLRLGIVAFAESYRNISFTNISVSNISNINLNELITAQKYLEVPLR